MKVNDADMKLIIFDLDGTLVNSLEDLADAANSALKKRGFPIHETEKFRYFVGNGIPKLIERVLPEDKRVPVTMAEVKADFDAYYHSHYADKTKPYAGINELLSALKSRGYILAVASNKADEFTKAIVNSFFNGIFSIAAGSSEGIARKPAPDIVYKIMEEAGADKKNTILIGDSNVDVMTAKNAGIKCIGCLWGFRTSEELEAAGADFLAEKPSDIYAALQGT